MGSRAKFTPTVILIEVMPGPYVYGDSFGGVMQADLAQQRAREEALYRAQQMEMQQRQQQVQQQQYQQQFGAQQRQLDQENAFKRQQLAQTGQYQTGELEGHRQNALIQQQRSRTSFCSGTCRPGR